MVTRGVLVVEGRLAEPVRERVHAERRVVDEAQASCTSVDETTEEVTPEKTRDDRGNNEAHGDNERNVPSVLPSDNRVLGQVAHVGNTRPNAGLDEHPANVRPEETTVSIVRVQLRVGVPMVSTVASAPPLN